jgi:CRISPR-associated protein Cmr1
MKTLSLQLQFHTPAFLGDATQSARWRTPPFKAQLRQWWRVAYAAQRQFAVNVGEMRDIEGHLFGHA